MAIDSKYGRVTFERGNISENEPVFVLRAQDLLADGAILYYAKLVKESGGNMALVEAIMEVADKFCDWQTRKMPD